MKRFFILFIAFIPLIGAGQSSIHQADDTIIYYNRDIQNYVLNLIGKNQAIYFDSSIYDNNRPINILIKNNTADTITITYKSLISSKVAFKENSSRYIKPGEHYSLSPIFNQQRYSQSSLLNAHFAFSYSLNDQPVQVIFRLKGHILLDSLPGFKKEELPDFIIASSPLPNSFIPGQNLNMTKPNFVFRRELRIYPQYKEIKLPEDLSLKYYIDKQEFIAKTGLDSLHQHYFEIPSKFGDSIYFVINAPKYGIIAKNTFVRHEMNDLTIPVILSIALSEPHYYNLAGDRVPVNKSFTGSYYIPRDYANNDYSIKRIDSLNALIKNYNAVIKYGWDGGFILKCEPRQSFEIKKKLGNTDFHQLIEERKWVTDYYDLFFDPKLSKEKISEMLKPYGITDFFVNYKETGNNERTNSIYRVTIKLDNVPGKNTNNQLINELFKQKEILKIVQETIHFPVTNE